MNNEQSRSDDLSLPGLLRMCADLLECFGQVLPKEFWEHRRNAHRETLLALRALIDAAIKALEGQSESERAGAKQKGKIKVE